MHLKTKLVRLSKPLARVPWLPLLHLSTEAAMLLMPQARLLKHLPKAMLAVKAAKLVRVLLKSSPKTKAKKVKKPTWYPWLAPSMRSRLK